MTTINVAPIPASPDDLVPLVNWVKASEAVDIQSRIARLLTEQIRSDGPYSPPYANNYGPKDAWELPKWTAGEEAAAMWIVGDLGPKQQRVLARIVASRREGIWTGELRRIAGYDDSTSMSGVFKALGGRFRATGHRPVWNGGPKDSQKGQLLSVLEDAAGDLFTKVIKDSYPDLAAEAEIG